MTNNDNEDLPTEVPLAEAVAIQDSTARRDFNNNNNNNNSTVIPPPVVADGAYPTAVSSSSLSHWDTRRKIYKWIFPVVLLVTVLAIGMGIGIVLSSKSDDGSTSLSTPSPSENVFQPSLAPFLIPTNSTSPPENPTKQ